MNLSAGSDLPDENVRALFHRTADLAADYLAGNRRHAVLPRVKPGQIRAALPGAPPEKAEAAERILNDYLRLIEPNVTHWNHPGFMAYFGITGSAPGIAAELLAASLNVNAMLWRSGPAPTELEEQMCDWLRQMIALPPAFIGHINDTASISSLLAIAAARERQDDLEIRQRGMAGRGDLPALTVYCSDQAHSSIDKAMITLGLGLENLRRVKTNDRFEMDVATLREAIAKDRREGRRPISVVATAGTTATTSVDPIAPIADCCEQEKLWLHVDAAYAGSAAICPEYRALMHGIERADSIVVNPHKWMFVPVDCSVLWLRDPDLLKRAFSVVPAYLRTSEVGVTNLMDYGPQLGRRFRALKLWFVIRSFGVRGMQERIRTHCAMARNLARSIEADAGFELTAPHPFSVVCFRARFGGVSPEECDLRNRAILDRVNADGRFFLIGTELRGRFTLRVAIGNLRTTSEDVDALWDLLKSLRREITASK